MTLGASPPEVTTGIGWEIGVLAGLLDEGVDLRGADTVIGTWAGSFVGANYTSGADWLPREPHALNHRPVAGHGDPVHRPCPRRSQKPAEAAVRFRNHAASVVVRFGSASLALTAS